ncbi:hypothetical protein ACFSGX_15640 [Sphingomonas arantia]|uniref:Uncharacterized protein n=1 Tax=Sphingomonas arantia TaxID=1460676 RepID=A0ABW4U2W5_9SPHN
MSLLLSLALLAAPAVAQPPAAQIGLDTAGACRRVTLRDPAKAGPDKAVALGCVGTDGQFRPNLFSPDGKTNAVSPGATGISRAGEYNYFSTEVLSDRVSQTVPTSGQSSKVNGINSLLNFGGPGTRGGRHAIKGTLVQLAPTEADNPDRNYVGVQGQSVSTTGDGGTPQTPRGAYFGMSSITQIRARSRNLLNATAFESNVDTEPGSTLLFRSGIQIADHVGARGSAFDAALSISGLNGRTLGAKNAVLIGSQNGGNALGPDSTVLRVTDSPVLENGFYAPDTIFTGYLLRSKFTALNDTGLSLLKPNAALELGSQETPGTPYVDLHSSGRATDYDARIIASGGTGKTGGGTVTVVAASINLPKVLLAMPLHVHPDNAAAIADGDPVGQVYRTATGVLMVRY